MAGHTGRNFFIHQTASVDFAAQNRIILFRVSLAGFGLLFGIECGYIQNVLLGQVHHHRFHHSGGTVCTFAFFNVQGLTVDIGTVLRGELGIHGDAAVAVRRMTCRTNGSSHFFAFCNIRFRGSDSRAGSQNQGR